MRLQHSIIKSIEIQVQWNVQRHSSFLDEMRENSHPISVVYLHISATLSSSLLPICFYLSSFPPLYFITGECCSNLSAEHIITTLLRHNTLNTEHFQRELLLLSNTKAGLGRLLNMTSFQINLPLAAQQIHANSAGEVKLLVLNLTEI